MKPEDRRLFHRAGSLSLDSASCVITPDTAGWTYSGLAILDLKAGESYVVPTATTEVAVLPLAGGCRVQVDDRSFDLTGRAGVFGEVTDWAYVPVASDAVVTATGDTQVALCSAEATRRIEPYYVPADEVSIEVRGGGVGTRQINNFLSADVHDADKLICVEVLTPPGNWSSYPPHKHDEWSDHEVPLEEIYYFRFDRSEGLGLFSVYTADGAIDATERVGDGDAVLVPRGYHGPSAPAPGYAMYFLNVMAGPSEDRIWKFTDDPAHAWARAMLDRLDPDPRLPM